MLTLHFYKQRRISQRVMRTLALCEDVLQARTAFLDPKHETGDWMSCGETDFNRIRKRCCVFLPHAYSWVTRIGADPYTLKKASWDWCSLYIYLGCRLLGNCGEISPEVSCRGLAKLSPEKVGRDSFYFINDALERCSSRKADSWSASLRTFLSFMEPKSLLLNKWVQ